MSVIKASGEENLRADAAVKNGSEKASPSGGGKDAGGTANLKEKTTTKSNEGKRTTVFSKDNRPSGVQTFDDDGV